MSSSDASASYRLVVARGTHKGKVFPIELGSNLVGRWDPDTGAFPEIDLEEVDEEAKISRKHAVIENKEGALTLEDLASLNGTFLNRETRIEPAKKYQLKAGDEIVFGKVFLVLEQG